MNKSRDKWIITVYFSIFCFWGDLVVSASFIPAQEEINCWGRQKERWGKEEAVEGERGKEDSWIHLSVLSLPLGISLLAKDMWRLQHFQTSAMPMNCELVCVRAVFYLWLVCTQTYRYTPYICWWLMCKSEPWYLCNHKASLQVYISLCVLTWECMFANVCSAIFACLSACVSVCVCVCVYDSPFSSPDASQPSSSSQSSPLPLSVCALPPSSSSGSTLVFLAQPSSTNSS